MTFSQEDIDAVLNQAQTAVDTLVADVNNLEAGKPRQDAAGPPLPVAPAPEPAGPGHAAAGPSPVPSRQRPSPSKEHIERILKLKVPVVVRLARRQMPVSEVLKIVPGTILEFEQVVDQELDLLANNRQIGAGVAVKVDEHFGLRVTYIGDIKDRINSLAG